MLKKLNISLTIMALVASLFLGGVFIYTKVLSKDTNVVTNETGGI